MKIIVTEVKAKDLEPGDLFSTANQEYWDTVCQPLPIGLSVGEKVYIRTPIPCPLDQADAPIYKLQILRHEESLPCLHGYIHVGDVKHLTGDFNCPGCLDGYPRQCSCGGLIHAQLVGEGVLHKFCERSGSLFRFTG